MGFIFLAGFGEKDIAIIEEIAKVHKLPVEKVAKAYENMLEDLKEKNETKE